MTTPDLADLDSVSDSNVEFWDAWLEQSARDLLQDTGSEGVLFDSDLYPQDEDGTNWMAKLNYGDLQIRVMHPSPRKAAVLVFLALECWRDMGAGK